MHPASYAEWVALIERYRRAVKVYSEAVRLLTGLAGPDYQTASERVAQAHLVCERLRDELRAYQKKSSSKWDEEPSLHNRNDA